MASEGFAIKRSITANNSYRNKHLSNIVQEQLNIFFKSIDIKSKSDDRLEFTAIPEENTWCKFKSCLRFKIRGNNIDFIANGTTGLSATGILTLVMGLLVVGIVGIIIAIYYAYQVNKIANAVFEQLFDSLDFELQ
ncbi:MAG TPA: hypothetical protein VMW16_08105 [Sedimentisphaerales bacterium]|nr:hypothetical protein [Sedimentisphaerales bacterium]